MRTWIHKVGMLTVWDAEEKYDGLFFYGDCILPGKEGEEGAKQNVLRSIQGYKEALEEASMSNEQLREECLPEERKICPYCLSLKTVEKRTGESVWYRQCERCLCIFNSSFSSEEERLQRKIECRNATRRVLRTKVPSEKHFPWEETS